MNMHKLIFIVSVVFLLSGCNFENKEITRAKESVKQVLNDPESAQFKETFLKYSVYVYSKEKGICGEVISKNEFGGYTGWKRFIVYGNHPVGSRYLNVYIENGFDERKRYDLNRCAKKGVKLK